MISGSRKSLLEQQCMCAPDSSLSYTISAKSSMSSRTYTDCFDPSRRRRCCRSHPSPCRAIGVAIGPLLLPAALEQPRARRVVSRRDDDDFASGSRGTHARTALPLTDAATLVTAPLARWPAMRLTCSGSAR